MSERKEFLVQITIIEGRYLKGLDAGGTSDPYVKITCGNLPSQVTVPREKTNVAIWNQSFTFKGLMMNEYELETWELYFEVYDRNAFFTDALLGSCSIGLGTMYRYTQHEFYRCWLSLFSEERPKESQGYLMVSCYIIGPGDKAPVHTENDVGIGDIDTRLGLVANEDMSSEERRAKFLREKHIHTLDKPNVTSHAYQLSINVYKAEGLPPDTRAFVAVRCSGVVLKTATMEKSENPAFQTTMLFPVYTPFLNDNVSVKVWNYFFGRSNQCIAQVCDEYGPKSDFNLNTLLKVGKVIGTRWYNLYSIREDHREIYGKRTREGKEYVGRILMRVSLLSTDNPQLGVVRATIGREPLSIEYVLFVDVFELRNASGLEEKIWVQAAIGNNMTQKSAYPKFCSEERAYTWETFEKQKLDEIEDMFPMQAEQCPDIFIYLWTEESGLLRNAERLVGYARMKAKDCIDESQKAKWITMKPIKPGADSPGELSVNIQLAAKGGEAARGPTDFEKKNYKLGIRVKSGFYMAPGVEKDEDLETYLEVYVGRTKQAQTSTASGRYPVWNHNSEHRVMLNADLRYEGDLVVMAYRNYKGLFGTGKELVGQFALKLLNVRATRIKLDMEQADSYYFKEYYNLVKDSTVNGRILAFFDLEECDPNEDETVKETEKPTDGLTIANVEKLNIAPTEVKITITALCLRNLTSSAKKPVLKFKLSDDPDNTEYVLKVNEGRVGEQEASANPYILNTIQFETKVSDNVSDWPFLKIELTDEGFLGCKNGYTTLLLFPFADFVSESDKRATILMFNTNVDVNKTRSRAGTTKKGSSIGSKLSHRSVRTLSGSHRSSRTSKSAISSVSSLSVIEDANEDGSVILEDVLERPEEEKNEDGNPTPSIRSSRAGSSRLGSVKAPLTEKEMEDLKTLAADELDEEKALMDNLYYMHFQEFETIQCTRIDKQTIKDEAERLAKELDALKRELLAIKGNPKQKLRRDRLIKEFNKNIEKLVKKGTIDADEFRGFDRDDEDDDDAIYNNREILRGEYETTMDLPYSRIHIYSRPTFGYKDSGIKSPYKQEKQELVGLLKCKITIEKKEEADKASTVRSKEQNEVQASAQTLEDKPKDKFTIVDEINNKFPFDVHKGEFLNYMRDTRELKIRAYIIQCHNLSAVDSYSDLKSAMAGYSAECSANPYLELQVGNGKNDNGLVRYIDNSKKAFQANLNPRMKTMYPMDLVLPNDNTLDIRVKSKGKIVNILIGHTTIDLEDRYYGDAYIKASVSTNLYKNYYKQKMSDEENTAEKKSHERIKRLKRKCDEINRLKVGVDRFEQLRKIEFRQLIKEGKLQAQGNIEMWLDIFPADTRYPEYNLNASLQNNYELRLIIWSLYNVPKIEGKNVLDGYVTATFESSNWSQEAITKSTDTHYGSDDGHCIFNYRMKFQFELPGEPRLKIQTYDFNTLGSNDSIGNCSLLLKPLCRKLAKEGKCETEAVRLYLTHPNFPDSIRGEVEIQMSLVTKEEANNHPVGEAQDEPNENPQLEKPTEGRGIGAFLKGSFLDVSRWSFPKFGLFTILKYALLMGGAVVVMGGLLVMVKFI